VSCQPRGSPRFVYSFPWVPWRTGRTNVNRANESSSFAPGENLQLIPALAAHAIGPMLAGGHSPGTLMPTAVRVAEVTHDTEEYRYRTPIKFGGVALDRAT